MKMFKTIPVFILLFTGYLCNAQEEDTTLDASPIKEFATTGYYTVGTTPDPQQSDHDPGLPTPEGRSLPTLVVAGVSIALVLLCILIVAIFWYAWKKSQEGSIELNPIPYGEAGVSLRSLSVPENQQEWPFERAVQ
ncbi:uncharacterized protein LOC143693935 isoform X2 [Agelaius phoeniceus]|uniref:uncharacterized protein LOC143693935 isoform X2 n=1 Tax=Agelaius phoeniceus TaxID=39638 RepID=UPI004054BD00